MVPKLKFGALVTFKKFVSRYKKKQKRILRLSNLLFLVVVVQLTFSFLLYRIIVTIMTDEVTNVYLFVI